MTEFIQVITTVDDESKAKEIQNILVQKRAAACAQVFGPILSCFWWEGKIEQAIEWVCVAKLKFENYEKAENLIKENHPYDVPEIVAIPISSGNIDYLNWIKSETKF
ncbi:MAG: divalent-cation tolerance protein CutA [Actinobacteria bacterium]|nr:divalent-cation tolerance protein CutA [Actinomycetota bacterium]